MGRHSVPILYRPVRVLGLALVLLACVEGILLAALEEAVQAHDQLWAGSFALFLLADQIIYWWIAISVISYTSARVYRDVDGVVDWEYDDDHHPGEG